MKYSEKYNIEVEIYSGIKLKYKIFTVGTLRG